MKNLFDNRTHQPSISGTKNLVEMNDNARKTYNTNGLIGSKVKHRSKA